MIGDGIFVNGTLPQSHAETKKLKSQKQRIGGGMDMRVYVNKDSPDYKPSYGTVYTARQQKVISGELSYEDVRLCELTRLSRKACTLHDDDVSEIVLRLIAKKEHKVYAGDLSHMTVAESKQWLRDHSPYVLDYFR